ncbi:tetratricopeptide repeat protein [Marinilabilia sp.]
MERKNHLILFSAIIFLLLSGPNGNSQNRDSLFFECYTTTRMDKWKQTMKQMAREREKGNYQQLFDVTLAWYGYIGYCLGNDREDEAEEYLESGWDFLEDLLEMPEADAAPYAIKSGFYGFEMALARYKTLILGPKSVSALKKAAEIDSTNVHYLVEKGNQMYYMPSLLGGDKAVALHHYKHAIEKMEKEETPYHRHHWFYINTLITLGLSYEKTDQIEMARETYLKIRRIAPQFKWLNEDVWPKFVEKYGK